MKNKLMFARIHSNCVIFNKLTLHNSYKSIFKIFKSFTITNKMFPVMSYSNC